jgi:hypothetical protein
MTRGDHKRSRSPSAFHRSGPFFEPSRNALEHCDALSRSLTVCVRVLAVLFYDVRQSDYLHCSQVSRSRLRRVCFTDGHRNHAHTPIDASRENGHFVSMPEMRTHTRRAAALFRARCPLSFRWIASSKGLVDCHARRSHQARLTRPQQDSRPFRPTTWNEFLPISMPIAAIALLRF